MIEPPYTAFGDNPSTGLQFSATHQINAYLNQQQQNNKSILNKQAPTVPPEGCQLAPKQIPTNFLNECVSQLVKFISDDVVPNVRICASQTLRIISGSLDKK